MENEESKYGLYYDIECTDPVEDVPIFNNSTFNATVYLKNESTETLYVLGIESTIQGVSLKPTKFRVKAGEIIPVELRTEYINESTNLEGSLVYHIGTPMSLVIEALRNQTH